MSHELHLSGVRNELEPRTEPYWGAPIATGRTVGLRKINAATASWIARMRVDDVGDQVRHKYKRLGFVSPQFDYDAAKAAAAKWFREVEAAADGPATTVITVADACRAYLKELRAAERHATAHDAERRFERTVYGRKVEKARGMAPDAKEIPPDPIAGVHLSKLEVTRLKDWRNDLPTKNLSTANRTLATLKAALNLAVENHPKLLAEKGLEWSTVAPHKIKEDTRRKLVLDLKQRRALVAAAKGPVRDLIRAASLTGARAGELTSATVSQFNPRTREITLTGKTGTRTVKLSTAAVALFRRLANGKKPTERLLTREERRAWAHSDWDGLIKDAAKAAKLPADTCLYTLRHTWISEQIAGGMTTLDVARLCGTSLVMIELHYGKTSKDVQQRLNRVAML